MREELKERLWRPLKERLWFPLKERLWLWLKRFWLWLKERLWLLLDDIRRAWLTVMVTIVLAYLILSSGIVKQQLDQFLIQYSFLISEATKQFPAGLSFATLRETFEGLAPFLFSYGGFIFLSVMLAYSTRLLLDDSLVERRGTAVFLVLMILLSPLMIYSIMLYRAPLDLDIPQSGNAIILRTAAAVSCFLSLRICVKAYLRRTQLFVPLTNLAILKRAGVLVAVWILSVVFVGAPYPHASWFRFPIDHIEIIRAVGPLAVLCFSAAVFVTICTAILVLGRRWRIPLFLPVIVLPVLANSYLPQESHPVRRPFSGETLDGSSYPKDAEALDRLAKWWSFKGPVERRNQEPIFIVSAEGGGIRAAYFTSVVLARIADDCPYAANRIFAISGVSGGAIGAAIYTAAIHQNPIGPDERRCNFNRSDSNVGAVGAAVDRIFQRDHLTPLLARMLLSDALLSASPLNIHSFDRQLGLEFSFENAFEESFGSPGLSKAFNDYVVSKDHPTTPYLLINTTAVEGAVHFVGSSLQWGKTKDRDSPDNIHFLDTFYYEPRFSLMSLAGMSARFPYVSPPGFVDGAKIGGRHFVDGGYYDNTGLVTALSLFRSLNRLSQRVVVLHIGNQLECNLAVPDMLLSEDNGCASLFYSTDAGSLTDALLGPTKVLLGVRTEQSNALRQQLESMITVSNNDRRAGDTTPPNAAIGFQITQDAGPEPLGWFLSGPALLKLRATAVRAADGLRCARGSRGDTYRGGIQGIGYSATLGAQAPDIERAFLGVRSGDVVPFANQCAFLLVQEFATRVALLDDPFKPGNFPDSGMPSGEIGCTYRMQESWLTYRKDQSPFEARCF